MSGILKSIADWFAANAVQFVNEWYEIVSSRGTVLLEKPLDEKEAFLDALKFLAFIAVIGMIIEIPVAALSEFDYRSNYFIVSSALVLFVSWIVYGAIMHLAMAAFGGKASLRQSIAVFCYFSAYFPIIIILQIPINIHYSPALQQSQSIEEMTEALMPHITPYFLLIYALSAAAFLWVVFHMLRIANRMHRLVELRAVAADLTFLVALVVFIAAIGMPVQHIVLKAFS